jgi:hypothetical protein
MNDKQAVAFVIGMTICGGCLIAAVLWPTGLTGKARWQSWSVGEWRIIGGEVMENANMS